MLRAGGYATIVDPDRPLAEFDTCSCCHCSAAIFVKPGTAATTYLVASHTPAGLLIWSEVPGAACWKCGCQPICLACEALGVCLPLERQLEQMEKVLVAL